jgi:Na+/melibiose symporter-like transporter
MQGVTSAVVVYLGTGSAAAVALVSVAQSVPQLVLGPWSGSLADRADPTSQIIAGRVLCLLGTGALAVFFVVVADPGPAVLVAVVFGCSFVVGAGFSIGGPAMQSVIPELVRAEELPTAMTLNTAPMTTARIAGPALGAFVLAWAGPATAYGVSAATHLVFGLLLVTVARLPRRERSEHTAAVSMRDGLGYLRRHPRLLAMLGGTALLGVGTEPTLTLAPAVSHALRGDTMLSGPLTLSFGIGSLAGLVVMPLLRRWADIGGTAAVGLSVTIVAMGLSAAVPVAGWVFGCFALAGAGFSWGMAGFSSLLQVESDRAYRGRVMAWWLIAFLGCRPVSSSVTGLVADLTSVRVALASTSVLLALCAVLLLRVLARHRAVPLVAPITTH